MNRIWFVVLIGMCTLIAGCGGESIDIEGESVITVSQEEPEVSRICVYICGQVMYPGVYEMAEGARVYEVVNRAGGLTPYAAAQYVNQAESITDGQQIYVPSVSECEAGAEQDVSSYGGVPGSAVDNGGRVNINTATESELTTIPGIGKSRAADIIAYRDEHGRFKSIEDIMKVSGIKDGLFAKIKDHITI